MGDLVGLFVGCGAFVGLDVGCMCDEEKGNDKVRHPANQTIRQKGVMEQLTKGVGLLVGCGSHDPNIVVSDEVNCPPDATMTSST